MTANFLMWPYRIVLFLLFMDVLLTFHCRHISHSSMLLFTFCDLLLLCTLPIWKKPTFISYRDNYDAVLYCELILCVQMFKETWKNFLPRALLIENDTDSGMPYNSAEIMNIKNFSEGQICIKGWRQSEIC